MPSLRIPLPLVSPRLTRQALANSTANFRLQAAIVPSLSTLSSVALTPNLVQQLTAAPAAAAANMSTMPAQHGHSQACCNIPPVIAKDYPIKGKYEDLDGMKAYVTGPDDATKAIMFIFDIFGYFPNTVQGADILAFSGDTKYKVVMPDWFDGNPANTTWYPPDTPEKQQNLGGFFQKNGPQTVKPRLGGVMKAVETKYPSIQSWGIVGLCWGGKAVSLLTSADDNPFKIGAECHPAMVSAADAESIKIPLCMLASKDEPADEVKKFDENLKASAKHVETFGDQVHGWMGARSNLEDEKVKSEYVRGYKTILEFFAKNW